MAKQRKKSRNDIYNQADRLLEDMHSQLARAINVDSEKADSLRSRIKQVKDIRDRYLENIGKQKADQRLSEREKNLKETYRWSYPAGDYAYLTERQKEKNRKYRDGLLRKSIEVGDKRDNKQWSRSTYMGLGENQVSSNAPIVKETALQQAANSNTAAKSGSVH